MIGHFFRIPTGADAEQESPVGHAIQRSDRLGEVYGVVLRDETDGGPQFELGRGNGSSRQSNKRIK
jgi:hypothetical protein